MCTRHDLFDIIPTAEDEEDGDDDDDEDDDDGGGGDNGDDDVDWKRRTTTTMDFVTSFDRRPGYRGAEPLGDSAKLVC